MTAPVELATMPGMMQVARKRLRAVLSVVFAFVLLLSAVFVGSRVNGMLNPVTNLVFEEINQGTLNKAVLKLGTYNIAHSRGSKTDASNWTGRTYQEVIDHLDEIATQIKASDCDLVVLNEVDFDASWSKRIDAAIHIAKTCGFRYLCEQKNVHVGIPFLKYSFGNAILSKYPLSQETFISLPPLSAAENLFAGNHDAVTCMVDTPLGSIKIVALHLDSRDEATRLRGLQTILKSDRVPPNRMPTVLLGDFNSTLSGKQNSPLTTGSVNTMDYLLKGNVYHTFLLKGSEESTFSATDPVRTIDYIVVSKDFAIMEKKTIKSLLSDHFMVTMTIARQQKHVD